MKYILKSLGILFECIAISRYAVHLEGGILHLVLGLAFIFRRSKIITENNIPVG